MPVLVPAALPVPLGLSVSVGVVVAVALVMVRVAVSRDGRTAYGFVSAARTRHAAWGLAAAAVTYAASWLLWQVPGLRWGWWSMLGGDGNPAVGSSSALPGWVPVVMVTLLSAAVLPLAYVEELLFRAGAHRWSPARRLAVSAGFGASHALAGVPLVFAAALTLTGAVFTLVYVRAHRRATAEPGGAWSADLVAVREATLVHAAHNYGVVALVVAGAAAG